MNNFKTRPSSRIAFTTLWMGSCLLGGFAIGAKVHTPWKMTTLQVAPLAWLPEPQEMKLAQVTPEELQREKIQVEVSFVPFEPLKPAALASRTFKRKPENWKRLTRAVHALQKAQTNAVAQNYSPQITEKFLEDYRFASFELRRDFHFALIPRLKSPDVQVAQLTVNSVRSSAAEPKQLKTNQTKTKTRIQKSTITKKYPEKKPEKRKPIHLVMGANHQVHQAQASTERPYQVPAVRRQEEKQDKPQFELPPRGLGMEDAKKLKELLLSEQVKSWNSALNPAPPVYETSTGAMVLGEIKLSPLPKSQLAVIPLVATSQPKVNSANTTIRTSEVPDTTSPEGEQTSSLDRPNAKVEDTGCGELIDTQFINPMGIQVCPSGHEWVSNSGWLKTQYGDSLPTLSLYPAPNTRKTLLLDSNSVALLGVKTGAKYVRGMGIIVGVAPEGYDVEFSGRAEEVEYFLVQGKRHFAVLNAEPGAGVIELSRQQGAKISATVFAPVLEDTITYLDLVEPTQVQFTVKVVKNSRAKDPEVSGLRLGISTQGAMQAITHPDGRAHFKNVYAISGYPVYVDVTSKVSVQRPENTAQPFIVGPKYRFALQERNKKGDYILRQMPDAQIREWVRQIGKMKQDDSIILGLLDRKKFGGFKEHHSARIKTLTPHAGYEPQTFAVLWDQKLSADEPLEGDLPRFIGTRVPEGVTQVQIENDSKRIVFRELLPVSPRVIHVISQ